MTEATEDVLTEERAFAEAAVAPYVALFPNERISLSPESLVNIFILGFIEGRMREKYRKVAA